MLKGTPSPVLGYGFAIATVALAVVLTLFLEPIIMPSVFSLFFAAVIVSAWYGGLGPGLLATALSSLALEYFFMFPTYSFSSKFSWDYPFRLLLFGLVALLISSLTAARKRAEEALRRAHDELEMRVQERTAELAKANKTLQAEIAERKEAEAEVAQVTKELIERNKELWRLQGEIGRVERLASLGRITGSIAHELGTPLNSVLGHTQLLARDDLPEGARRRLQTIKTQVQRMVDIINSYLSRARGPLQRHDPLNINELILDTVELLKPIFQQHNVQVRTALADSLPLLSGDGASLQRVLINLLDNAVDAIERGGTVTITTTVSNSPDSKPPGLTIEVKDTGMGIAPELLPKIFEFFVTTKAPGKGTGLGLAICQEIIKAHGGTIEIKSQVEKGTAVRIFLPTSESANQSTTAEAGNE